MSRQLWILVIAGLGCGCSTRGPSPAPTAFGFYESSMGKESAHANTLGMSPEPFGSGVAVSTPLVFRVDVASTVALSDIEASISVSELSGAAVAGSFSWLAAPSIQDPAPRLEFRPATGAWKDQHDYVVTVSPVGSFQPAWALFGGNTAGEDGTFKAVFTTGAHLRVGSMRVVSKDGGNTAAYVLLRFSEPADLRTTLKALTATQQGRKLLGTITDPLPMYWANNVPVKELRYDFSNPPTLSQPLSIVIGAVATPAGSALDPTDFAAPSLSKPAFAVDLDAASLAVVGAGAWLWHPKVN